MIRSEPTAVDQGERVVGSQTAQRGRGRARSESRGVVGEGHGTAIGKRHALQQLGGAKHTALLDEAAVNGLHRKGAHLGGHLGGGNVRDRFRGSGLGAWGEQAKLE